MRLHVDAMQATDMRRLSHQARHERRVQVIGLRKAGRTYDQIAALTGLSRTGVFDICKRHATGGAKALHDAPGGRRVGDKRRLSAEQEAAIRKLIADQTPDQLNMPYALWTRAAVAALIEQRWGMVLPVRTMDLYLSRWGLTLQKPIPKVGEQYPAILARARLEGAQIHWGNEMELCGGEVRCRSHAPQSQTPVGRVNRKGHRLSMISAVTNKGTMRWKSFEGALGAAILIDFLQRLIEDAGRKVYLILDNQKAHHGKPVQAWLAEHQRQIEVFYLPSDRPKRNPDEMAQADLKQAVTKLAVVRTELQRLSATAQHLRSVQGQPERVNNHFEHGSIRYAA